MGAGQDPQLLLHHGNAQRRVGGDVLRQRHREALQILAGDDIVDHAEALGPFRRDRLRRECHLLPDPEARRIQEREHPGDVVGNAEPRGSYRKRGAGVATMRSQAKAVSSASPHPALDHRDHRRGEDLNFADQRSQRIGPPERIAPRFRKLLNIVAGRPDLGSRRRTQDDDTQLACLEVRKRRRELVDQGLGQRIALALVVQRDDAQVSTISVNTSGMKLSFPQDERDAAATAWRTPPGATALSESSGRSISDRSGAGQAACPIGHATDRRTRGCPPSREAGSVDVRQRCRRCASYDGTGSHHGADGARELGREPERRPRDARRRASDPAESVSSHPCGGTP